MDESLKRAAPGEGWQMPSHPSRENWAIRVILSGSQSLAAADADSVSVMNA
jgi:hypothetical protein